MINRHILPRLTLSILAGCLLGGCQSHDPGTAPRTMAEKSTRSNCYSLLHELLSQEKNISLLRFIKREHEDVKSLVLKIATQSAAGAKLLEEFARNDPTFNLEDIRLPSGESATRDAISATRKGELLSKKGEDFALTLLLTQTEALNYGAHLAKVAAANEPKPDRASAMSKLSRDLEELYHEVFLLLLLKSK